MAQEVQNTTTVSVKIVTKEKTRILLSNYHFENRFISKFLAMSYSFCRQIRFVPFTDKAD